MTAADVLLMLLDIGPDFKSDVKVGSDIVDWEFVGVSLCIAAGL
jgi:hypothetical protein